MYLFLRKPKLWAGTSSTVSLSLQHSPLRILLRQRQSLSPKRAAIPSTRQGEKLEDLPADAILCKFCRNIITSKDKKIDIAGSHQHTLFNPEGIVFEVVCFKDATGCRVTGGPTLNFSWFEGFTWQFSLCSKCSAHLGWFYLSQQGQNFFGLIQNKLLEPT